MTFKHYDHLNVPDSWERYFTKYPQGMSILEALFEWVSQVDSMVDNQNKLNDNVAQFRKEIDAFVERFDDRLEDEVTQTLQDWQNSGFLDVVISEALQWQLNDYIATNEADKLSLSAQLQQTEQNLNAKLANLTQTSNIVVTVGNNGDYATINEAIEYLSKKNVSYKQSGVKCEIMLLSGFEMREQVLVNGVDLGYITISSQDNIVVLRRDFLTKQMISSHDSTISAHPAFGVTNNGVLPIINVLFDMFEWGSGTSANHAFFVADNSQLYIMPGCGCTNAGTGGIFAINSAKVVAYGSIFDNAKGTGVTAFRGSHVNVRGGSFKNCKGSAACYLGSSSVVEALGTDFSGSAGKGVWVYGQGQINVREGKITDTADEAIYAHYGSFVTAGRCDLSRSRIGIYAQNTSIVEALAITLNDFTEYGVRATQGSVINIGTYGQEKTIMRGLQPEATYIGIEAVKGATVNADKCEIYDVKRGIVCDDASTVNFADGIINGCSRLGITVSNTSTVNMPRGGITNCEQGVLCNVSSNFNGKESTINNNLTHGVQVSDNSRASLNNAAITANGEQGVYVTEGSHINLRGADISGNDHVEDLRMRSGSLVNANNMIGDYTGTADNTITDRGIIFKNVTP